MRCGPSTSHNNLPPGPSPIQASNRDRESLLHHRTGGSAYGDSIVSPANEFAGRMFAFGSRRGALLLRSASGASSTGALPTEGRQCGLASAMSASRPRHDFCVLSFRPSLLAGLLRPLLTSGMSSEHLKMLSVNQSEDPSQISLDTTDRLQRATAGFTTSTRDGCGLRDRLPAGPVPQIACRVLVHRPAS